MFAAAAAAAFSSTSTTDTTRESPPPPPPLPLSSFPSHTPFVHPRLTCSLLRLSRDLSLSIRLSICPSFPPSFSLARSCSLSLPVSLFLSVSVARAESLPRPPGAPSRVEPPFRAPPDSAPATQRNQTRAGSRVRRGVVLPRMAEASALLGLCPVFASSCVPADVLCTRDWYAQLTRPYADPLLCTCTRLHPRSPFSTHRPPHLSHTPSTLREHAIPSFLEPLSLSLSTAHPPSPCPLSLPLALPLTTLSLTFSVASARRLSVAEVSRSPPFGPRVYLRRPCSLDTPVRRTRISCVFYAVTARNVAPRSVRGFRLPAA